MGCWLSAKWLVGGSKLCLAVEHMLISDCPKSRHVRGAGILAHSGPKNPYSQAPTRYGSSTVVLRAAPTCLKSPCHSKVSPVCCRGVTGNVFCQRESRAI